MAVRILLVDDSPYDRELARRALGHLAAPPGPADLLCADDWDAGRSLLHSEPLDLLLLDFNLPGMSGLDILQELQGRPHPPIVMMTGQEDVATAVETLRAGAWEYVPKSVDYGPILCRVIERVLERVRLERELGEARARLAAYAADLEHKVTARTAVVRAQASEIEQLYLKAEEAARVKAEIVANVSHELRTPLNVILGYAELLEELVPAETVPAAHDMLAKVRGQAGRLRVLIDSLLALGRLNADAEPVLWTRFPLAPLAAELHAEAEALNGDRALTIGWTAPADCEVESDREKLRAIGYHLISNAVKFTPAGRVELALVPTPVGGIRLTVSDTGIGLPPEARAVIFEDFRQLDGSSTRRFEGLGLGLGIVRRYSEILGGRVTIEDRPGGGTVVAVELPAPGRGRSPAVALLTPGAD